MPTVEQNVALWGGEDSWGRGGDEWSDPFGGTDSLWDIVLAPRIGHLLGGRTVEIAPGYGRITSHLISRVDHLVAVDLNQNCIDRCRERFAGTANLELYKNDGKTLPMVADASVDFVFSFDSLVHADADVMASYLAEIARVLTPTGTAFIHHSNVGSYLNPVAKVTGDQVGGFVNKRTNQQWRGTDVSAARLRRQAHALGLKLNVAEQVNWESRLLNDCFSLFSRSGNETTIRNWRFFQNACAMGRVVTAYRATRPDPLVGAP